MLYKNISLLIILQNLQFVDTISRTVITFLQRTCTCKLIQAQMHLRTNIHLCMQISFIYACLQNYQNNFSNTKLSTICLKHESNPNNIETEVVKRHWVNSCKYRLFYLYILLMWLPKHCCNPNVTYSAQILLKKSIYVKESFTTNELTF